MIRSIFTIALAVGLLSACGKKKTEESTTTGSATVPVATGSGSAAGSADMGSGAGSAAAAAAVDVPTEVDFEDQASTDITDKNVEAKVKALEGDLAPQ